MKRIEHGTIITVLTVVLICGGGALSLAVAGDGKAGSLEKPAAGELRMAQLKDMVRQYTESLRPRAGEDSEFSAQTTYSDGFEVDFSNWAVQNEPPGSPGWERTTFRSNSGSYSAWAGADLLDPASGYVNDMLTFMTAVVDLSGYTDGTLEYYTFFDTELSFDGGFAFLTTDGVTFGCGPFHTGTSSGWQSVQIDLTAVPDCDALAGPFDFTGAPLVNVVFVFGSDLSIDGFAGFYVDDVLISPTTPSVPAGDFFNVSTRGFVGTGADVLIAGIIIEDDVKPVMFRALGPTLAQPPFNLTGVLADPMIQVYDQGGTLLDECDNWQTCTGWDRIPAGLQPPDALEPALVLDLAPGEYTAILSGMGGGTGVAIIEGYGID
jgi:hypothetical protein